MNVTELKNRINSGSFDAVFADLYGSESIDPAKERYSDACDQFLELYGDRDNIRVFSAPGRTEVIGNHTDHNCGKVVAAAVNLDVIAIACASDDSIIRVKSKGYVEDVIDLNADNYPAPERYFTSKALIAGITEGVSRRSYKVGGFCAYTTSNVLKGSGLSSSAAFEVLITTIINHLYCDGQLSFVDVAKISQFAENNYFGKPCGLMDQMACASGGLVAIDFMLPDSPEVTPLVFDVSRFGYSLVIVATGGNHSDLNDDYAAVPGEMKKVAAYFGKNSLRDLTLSTVLSSIGDLRSYASDRAILRAIHFFNENERVDNLKTAVQNDDIDTFLSMVSESGRSSERFLQNIFTPKAPGEQGLSLAIALTELFTTDSAVRVHGGGFAGTVQAYIKSDEVEEYKNKIDAVFGKGATRPLFFRKQGAIELKA